MVAGEDGCRRELFGGENGWRRGWFKVEDGCRREWLEERMVGGGMEKKRDKRRLEKENIFI